MPTWTCTIPGYDLISPNKLLRMQWFRQAKEKELAMTMIGIYGRPLPSFAGPVRMVIVAKSEPLKTIFFIPPIQPAATPNWFS